MADLGSIAVSDVLATQEIVFPLVAAVIAAQNTPPLVKNQDYDDPFPAVAGQAKTSGFPIAP